jgi:DNA-binding PadR family transcriptional regulator
MRKSMEYRSDLPLTEVTYFILLSLLSKPKHGYAIMKDVRSLSEDRVVLSTGTLYGAIKRLLEQGWIQRIEDSKSGESQRQRKVYRLTSVGRQVLDAEVHRLNSLVAAARLRAAGKTS